DAAHWPKFPAQVGTPGTGKLPVDLISKQPNNPTAAWVTAKNDVVLTLKGVPVAATVRVYPRKFISDAREARGDGAGGIVPDGGTLVLLLKDPLGLGNQPHSDAMTLSCDVMVVERGSNSRLYGNISAPIKTEVAAPASNATNPYSSA